MRASTVAIADIKIGKRHRRGLGDIAGLVASIADVGLLHAVVITPFAGQRRLRGRCGVVFVQAVRTTLGQSPLSHLIWKQGKTNAEACRHVESHREPHR